MTIQNVSIFIDWRPSKQVTFVRQWASPFVFIADFLLNSRIDRDASLLFCGCNLFGPKSAFFVRVFVDKSLLHRSAKSLFV